jgi:hypothetical protein
MAMMTATTPAMMYVDSGPMMSPVFTFEVVPDGVVVGAAATVLYVNLLKSG